MNSDTLQILKACAVAFLGNFVFCYLGLLVHRCIKKDAMLSASGGLPLILSLGQFAVLGVSFSMLGSMHFAGVALLILAYASALGAVFLIGRKYPGK